MENVTERQFGLWADRLNRSDESALDELFKATFEPFVRYAWRYTRDKSSAVDIVQECFIKLWEIRSRLDSSQSLKTYIYRMVKYKALNYLRDRREDTISLEEVTLIESADSSGEPPESSPLVQQLSEWVRQLPERQKQAFELSRYEGLTHDEIAEVMEVSPRTVNNHIVAALNTLKEEYERFRAERREAV